MKTVIVSVALLALSAPAYANGLGLQNSSLFGNVSFVSSNGTVPSTSNSVVAQTRKIVPTASPVTAPSTAASGGLRPNASSRISGLLGMAASAGSTSSTR